MVDGVWVPIIMFSSVPIIAVGYPLARAYAKRMERADLAAPVPSDVSARLERMEQAIDSIAVEVERISEGQRFTTRLLSERVPAPGALPEAAPVNAPSSPRY